MKLNPLALLAFASSSAVVAAFATVSARSTTSTTALGATLQSDTKTLLPPLSMAEIMAEEGRVSTLYDTNVQKTYG
jgi:hypothetical protein